MFTLLVLVGCLAPTLALPPIASVVGGAATFSDVKKPLEVFPAFPAIDKVKDPTNIYVKECLDKCAVLYESSRNDYKYCIIGCNLGGQTFVDKKGVVPAQVGAREARGFESCLNGYCRYVAGIPPALVPCMGVCLAAGGRRRSIDYPKDEIAPLIGVDFKKVPVVPAVPVVDSETTEDVKQCFERCTVAYGNSGVDFLRCIYRCSHEDPNFEIPPVEKIVKPIVKGKVREARTTLKECTMACLITGPFFGVCVLASCSHGLSRSLEEDAITPKVTLDKKAAIVAPFYPEFVGKKPNEFYVKDCLDKCAVVYESSSNDYKYCVIGCNLGGQKFVEKEGVVPTGGRQARSYDSCYNGYCYWVQSIPPAFLPCMGVCLAAGGRRRSIDYPMDEITPLIDVDYKKVPVAPVVNSEATEDVKLCFERCTVAFGNSGVDFLRCIYRCSHEDPNFEIPAKKIVKPIVDGKREARLTKSECVQACALSGALFYNTCVATSCKGLSRSLEGVAIPAKVTLDKNAAAIAPFYPEFVDKKPTDFYIKECLDKCAAVYESSSNDYKYCIVGCNLGGQKFVDKKVVVEKIVKPIVDDKREARITRAQCEQNCFVKDGPFYYTDCISERCKGLSRSLEDVAITPKVTLDKKAAVVAPFYPEFVDKKPVEFYVKECYERCESLYKKTETDYNYCLIGCTVGGQKFEDKVAVVDVKPVAPIKV